MADSEPKDQAEIFDEWVYRLHSIARNPPLTTGSYRQLSHLVRDIYEAGWKACAARQVEEARRG